MITVRDLADALIRHCRPGDGVSLLSEHYHNRGTTFSESDVILVVGNGEVTIVADQYYLKEEAKRRLGTAYTGTFMILERKK